MRRNTRILFIFCILWFGGILYYIKDSAFFVRMILRLCLNHENFSDNRKTKSKIMRKIAVTS